MSRIKPRTVSIIVATYNWPEALAHAIKSIFIQDRLPEEILIADDGSNAITESKIEELRADSPIPIRRIWHPDQGFRLAAIRNKAIARAQSDYIIQIDGDIILDRHFISDHLEMVDRGYFLCGSRVWVSREQSAQLLNLPPGSPVKKRHLPTSSILNSFRSHWLAGVLADRYKKNQPTVLRGCNMSFWKADLMAINGYNESIQGWGSEDAELAIRLINHGVKKRFLKFSAVAYHLYHQENSKVHSQQNEQILEQTIQQGSTWAANGIEKPSPQTHP